MAEQRFTPMVTQDYQDGYKKGAADCAGSLARLDEMERQRDAAWLESRRLRDALIGLRALVKAELPSMECVDIDKADSALANRDVARGCDVVRGNDIRALVKRWLAKPHRTSPTQPYQCAACRILTELMECLDAIDPHVDSTGKPTTREGS